MLHLHQHYFLGKIISSMLIVAFLSLSLQGCYSYRVGELERLDKIPGSEELINYSYNVNLVKKPKTTTPQIEFKVERTPKYKYKAQEKFAVEKWRSYKNEMVLWGSISLSLLIGGLIIAGTAKPNKNEYGNTIPSTQQIIGGVLAIASWIPGMIGGLITGWPKNTKEDKLEGKTGKLIDGDNVYQEEVGNSQPTDGIKVNITINKVSKEFTSNKMGIIVDLTRDFNLVRFDNTKIVNVKCNSVYYKIKKTFTFHSRDWTIPYIQIIRDDTSVETEKDGKLVKLGKLNAGNEYKILHEGNDLIKIEFNGEEGFIPKGAGNKFWAVGDYLDLTK